MESRDTDQTTPHHEPLLGSLVVRPTVSDGAGYDVRGGGGGGGGGDYEPGEVRFEPPSYFRFDRHSDEPGFRTCAGSASPVRRRDADDRNGYSFDHSGGTSYSREFGSRMDTGRYRDPSPHHARGRGGHKPPGRAFHGPAFGPGPFRGNGVGRNNPNVQPREGDWICPDPLCANLNFARHEYCNNCKRFRYTLGESPRRRYHSPPPLHLLPPPPPRRFAGTPIDISPGRTMNRYGSPPHGWARDGPRDFGSGVLPPPQHEGRFSDHTQRERGWDIRKMTIG